MKVYGEVGRADSYSYLLQLFLPRVVWTKDMEDAFSSIRKFLCQQCVLTILLPSDTFSNVTDASALGLGGVLQVERDGEWKAVAYHSRHTRRAERNYSATELEARSRVDIVKHLSYYLYGREFTPFTNHKALCFFLSTETDNRRLRRLVL